MFIPPIPFAHKELPPRATPPSMAILLFHLTLDLLCTANEQNSFYKPLHFFLSNTYIRNVSRVFLLFAHSDARERRCPCEPSARLM
jgi:hypothetical protein